jgi:hypothetical protein
MKNADKSNEYFPNTHSLQKKNQHKKKLIQFENY